MTRFGVQNKIFTTELFNKTDTSIAIFYQELVEEEEISAVSPLVSFWIEFNQFFNSFAKLYVFHKAGSYSCHRSVSDMRVSNVFLTS